MKHLQLLPVYRHYVATMLLTGLSVLPLPATAAQDEAQSSGQVMPTSHDEHGDAKSWQRAEVKYELPDVNVVRQDGKKVSFKQELDDGRIVVLNFIYASCNAICPMLSYVFQKVQTQLGANIKQVHLVSVSLDPENDTPTKLLEYAKKFDAGSNWDHYTGSWDNSIAIQKALKAFRGDKMNHTPITFIRAKAGGLWIRLDGFAKPEEVVSEIKPFLNDSEVSKKK